MNPAAFTPRPTTNCAACGGTGWIATKGYRFYSANGRACTTCRRFASTVEAGNYLSAEGEARAAAEGAAAMAAQKADRLARRAARKAAQG
jgi:hypothetical protein